MKAIRFSGAGGPEVITLQDVPTPEPSPGEVLIDVAAAGINRADILQRRGLYAPPPGATDIPGLEVSGHVAALGPGADGFMVGDPVVALLEGGGYAGQVAVPAGQVLPLPQNLELVAGAAIPETAATVVANLFLSAGLRPGETVLIHGAAGGVGAMAVQLAAAAGAVVIATAGSAAKLAFAESLGAGVVIDYGRQDFTAVVREATEGRGADVILDIMGASYLERNLDALAIGGRLVIIGLQGGTKAELDLGRLMARRATVMGSKLRARPAVEKAAVMGEVRRRVWPLLSAGTVKPQIDRIFPLDKTADAHQYFDSGSHRGKVLLLLGGA